jgi:PST family polysaccharide transporter
LQPVDGFLVFVLQAPGLVAEALLQREMNLRAMARAEVLGVAIGYLPLGIGGALLGFGVWALVAAHLGQTLCKCLGVLGSRPHEWSLLPQRQATRELLWFSGGFVIARLGNVTAGQADNLVVGRWMTAADLGIYGRAYQLMAMPAMFLGEAVDRVIFPLLARVQHDREQLRTAFGRGVSLVATVMAPAACACTVLAPEIVRVVLGADWHAVAAPFAVLMTGLVFRTGYKLSDVLARATGTVYARAWRQLAFAGLIVVGAFVGTRWGVTGVAWGIVAALGANYVMMAWLSLATTGTTWWQFAALHRRGVAAGAAVGAVVWAAAEFLRAVSAHAWIVLLGAALSTGGALVLAARWSPRHVLGDDCLWLLRTLAGRSGRPSSPAAADLDPLRQ